MINAFTNISVKVKIIAVSAFLAAVFLFVSTGFTILSVQNQLKDYTNLLFSQELVSGVEKVTVETNHVKDTLLSLSGTPPIQGIVRARNVEDGFDELENSTYQQWRQRLASIFSAEMNATKVYDQLRYINEDGDEMVRVNFIDGFARVVPEDELQNKSERDYFKSAMKINKGEVFVSNPELNKEGSPPVLSQPLKPVIRFSVPVFDENTNKRKGVLLANVFVDQMIQPRYIRSEVDADIYVIDSDGYFIIHPDKSKEWGGPEDLNTGINFQGSFPNLPLEDIINKQGSLEYKSELIVYDTVVLHSFDRKYNLLIIKSISLDKITKPINNIILAVSIVSLITFIVLFFVFLFSVQAILRPSNEDKKVESHK